MTLASFICTFAPCHIGIKSSHVSSNRWRQSYTTELTHVCIILSIRYVPQKYNLLPAPWTLWPERSQDSKTGTHNIIQLWLTKFPYQMSMTSCLYYIITTQSMWWAQLCRRLFDLNLKATRNRVCCHRIRTQWGPRKSKEYKEAQPNMLIECGTRITGRDMN